MTQEEISIQKKNPAVTGNFQQDSLVCNRQKLRIFAISLAVIGVLAVIAGIASAMVLGSPIMLLMAVQGLLILIIATVFLLKIRQPKISLPSETPPAETPSAETPPEVITKDFSKQAVLKMLSENCKAGEYLSGTFYDFRLSDYIQLTIRKGDITLPQVYIDHDKKGMVFNAANRYVSPGQGGVNKALSEAVTVSSWKNSGPAAPPLKPGDVSTGPWESSPTFINNLASEGYDPRKIYWSFLGQILGPKASDHQGGDCDSAFPIVKKGYRAAMSTALSLGCTSVQLPLLSCGNNAPKDPLQAKKWKCMVVMAFLETLSEISAETHEELNIMLLDCNSDILSDLD